MEILTSLLVLAALGEALVEYLIRPLVNALARTPLFAETVDAPDPPVGARDLLLRYLAAIVGVALAFAYQVDLLALFGLAPPWPWVGFLVTGIVLGRGSNFVHDFAGRWLSSR